MPPSSVSTRYLELVVGSVMTVSERESPCGADGVFPFQPPPLAPDAVISSGLAGLAVSTLNRRPVQSALSAVVSGRRIASPFGCGCVSAATRVTVPMVLTVEPLENGWSTGVVSVTELRIITCAALV